MTDRRLQRYGCVEAEEAAVCFPKPEYVAFDRWVSERLQELEARWRSFQRMGCRPTRGCNR